MADRVSATITIGGNLPADQLLELTAIINGEGLSTDWDGEDFTVSQLVPGCTLTLMAHEVAWGRFENLESFCATAHLPFVRWSGAYSEQWGAERVVFTGSGEPASFAADEEDHILVDRATIDRLATIEAVWAYFDAADFTVPPLHVDGNPGNDGIEEREPSAS